MTVVNSPLSYLGGKSKLAKILIKGVPVHEKYVEVFAGAAWVLFKKPRSKVEVINDINSELVTLYRVLQNHLEEFMRCSDYLLTARDEYNTLRDANPRFMTDIQRAARFYFLVKNTFGSKLDFGSFIVPTTRKPRPNASELQKELSAVRERLYGVTIENRPFAQVIKSNDKSTTFFYVDPPYFGCESDYGKGIFSRSDFEVLRDVLAGCSGRFMMSINNVSHIRNLFNDFYVKEVSTTYSVCREDVIDVSELVITNYDPDTVPLAYPDYK